MGKTTKHYNSLRGYILLALVVYAPSRKATQKTLAMCAETSVGAVSRAVNDLEKRGLVRVERISALRRPMPAKARIVTVTAAGRTCVAEPATLRRLLAAELPRGEDDAS